MPRITSQEHVDQSADYIYLKVKSQDGNEMFFRIKRNIPLKMLMNYYCNRQFVEINSIAFLFDGRRLHAEQTPDELEMTDGDEIHVLESKIEKATSSLMFPEVVMFCEVETSNSGKNDMDLRIADIESQLRNCKTEDDMDRRISDLEAQFKYGKNDMVRRMTDFESQFRNHKTESDMDSRILVIEAQLRSRNTEKDMERRISNLEAQLRNRKTENDMDRRISDLEAQLHSRNTENDMDGRILDLEAQFRCLKTEINSVSNGSCSEPRLSTGHELFTQSPVSTPDDHGEVKKPDDQYEACINLNVISEDGTKSLFRMKRTSQLKKLMNAFADKHSIKICNLLFLFNRRRLRREQTPDELEMQDGDEIHAMHHQIG